MGHMGYRWSGLGIPLPVMGRPRVANPMEPVCTRLTAEEKAMLDRLRGSLSRSAYLRLLVRAAGKRGGV